MSELCDVIGRKEFRDMTANLFKEAKQVYERDLFRRRLANRLLEYLLGLSPESMAEVVQGKLIALLKEEEGLSALQERLRNWICGFSQRLTNDPVFRQSVESWKTEMVSKHLHIKDQIAEGIAAIKIIGIEKLAPEGAWRHVLVQQSEQAVHSLAGNEERRINVNRLAKTIFLQAVAAHYEEIGFIVRMRLEQFTDRALADFIESRIGDDLQMIRINGSIVGGLAGMALFLLSCLVNNI